MSKTCARCRYGFVLLPLRRAQCHGASRDYAPHRPATTVFTWHAAAVVPAQVGSCRPAYARACCQCLRRRRTRGIGVRPGAHWEHPSRPCSFKEDCWRHVHGRHHACCIMLMATTARSRGPRSTRLGTQRLGRSCGRSHSEAAQGQQVRAGRRTTGRPDRAPGRGRR